MSFFNKKIINFNDKYFGMDLNDLSVKVFQLEKNGNKDSIRSFSSKKIKNGLIESGEIIDKEKVSEIIKEAIFSAGPKKINTKKVFCSIPESKVFLRLITIPEISKKEAEMSIKWEIEAGIPLSIDEVYYDWQFLDAKDGKQNVLTVAVSKKLVDELILVLESCGLMVYGLETESISIARSLVPKKSKENETHFIIDIGSEKTSFAIVEKNIPCFTSGIPFSSDGITDVLSLAMNLSKKEAEKLKISKGEDFFKKNSSANKSIKSFMENFLVEIEKTMDFYENSSSDKKEITKIIISGGGSSLSGLLPYISSRFKKEVILGDPLVNINLDEKKNILKKENLNSYATAIGLAMREINYGNRS